MNVETRDLTSPDGAADDVPDAVGRPGPRGADDAPDARMGADRSGDEMSEWPGLTRMAKIEVVVDGDDVPAVRELLVGAGATGYTAVPGVSGLGHHGHHQGRLLFNDRSSLSLVISIVPLDRAESVIVGIRRLLGDRHGVFFVSEAHVSRPEYFT